MYVRGTALDRFERNHACCSCIDTNIGLTIQNMKKTANIFLQTTTVRSEQVLYIFFILSEPWMTNKQVYQIGTLVGDSSVVLSKIAAPSITLAAGFPYGKCIAKAN